MRATILFLIGCWSSAAAIGAEPEFAPLAAGSDLTGWVEEPHAFFREKHPDVSVWSAADGVLHADGSRGNAGFLRYDRKLEDFVLRLEFKIAKGCNSGVCFRSPVPYTTLKPNTLPSNLGYELQIMDDAGKPVDDRGSGSFYGKLAPKVNAARPAGEWNTLELTCRGPRIRAVLNGETVQDLDQTEVAAFQDRPRAGYLFLQNHGGDVDFRRIQLQTLEPIAVVQRPPNFVLIFCDDLGYADLGCYGAKGYETPHLDRLAKDGMRFTDFYVPAAVCSASRAALLTGCYPQRVGILGALGPKDPTGIHQNEVLLPELLKEKGYATAIFGKWHLGHHPQFLPVRNGFDRYFGLPYSNDMWPKHPEAKPGSYPDLPLIDGEKTIELNPDQAKLTTQYTEHAVAFIKEQRDNPFFLYVPHSMPHVPLFVSEKFKGKTKRGLFGDVISEIDWSVGQIVAALQETGNEERTLVVFTSDNGPWLSYGDHAGSAEPLREGKGTTWDGGQRVPCIARFPGVIPAGVECRELASTIDILPTFAKLAGTQPSTDRILDGRDLGPLLRNEPNAKSPHEAFFFYWAFGLEGVRSGKWKLHFPHAYRSLDGRPGGKDGIPAKYEQLKTELVLFDLENDLGETKDVSAEHPEIVARLKAAADRMRADLGDAFEKNPGKNRRPAGKLAAP